MSINIRDVARDNRTSLLSVFSSDGISTAYFRDGSGMYQIVTAADDDLVATAAVELPKRKFLRSPACWHDADKGTCNYCLSEE